MPSFVLDASVAISWCFPGDPVEDSPYSRKILAFLTTHDAVVPGVWGYEAANCIYVAFSRRKRITAQQVDEFLSRLKALPIVFEPEDLWSTVALHSNACQWNLAAYDAAYVELAKHKGIPLATTDIALRAAALAEGVKLL